MTKVNDVYVFERYDKLENPMNKHKQSGEMKCKRKKSTHSRIYDMGEGQIKLVEGSEIYHTASINFDMKHFQ